MNIVEFRENCIEFLTGEDRATLTLTQRSMITKFMKLHRARPAETDYIQNADGSVCAHMPVSWIRFTAPMKLTNEEKERRRAILAENTERAREKSGQIPTETEEVDN